MITYPTSSGNPLLLHPLLTSFLSLLITSTTAFECYARHLSPSLFTPTASDCLTLDLNLLLDPKSREEQTFADPHEKPVVGPYIELPKVYSFGTCYAEVIVDGRPFHDRTRLVDVAHVVARTATECLDRDVKLGRGVGGHDRLGDNNWLEVRVTGKVLDGGGLDEGKKGEGMIRLPENGNGNGTVGSSSFNLGSDRRNITLDECGSSSSQAWSAKRWVG